MARCELGYLCEVCGDEVAEIVDSDLYLSFVVGLVEPQALLARPERHIRCNPVQAQFIVDAGFPPVAVEGPFAGVVFNRPVDQVFSYRIPAGLRARVVPGQRVKVPLGRGNAPSGFEPGPLRYPPGRYGC